MPMIENMVQMAKLTVKANVFIVRTDMRLRCSVTGMIESPVWQSRRVRRGECLRAARIATNCARRVRSRSGDERQGSRLTVAVSADRFGAIFGASRAQLFEPPQASPAEKLRAIGEPQDELPEPGQKC
jgi:hypothetical protein